MKELVLTGFKDFWPKDEKNAIFLGTWCFANNLKYKFWDQRDFVLVPSPWGSHEDILKASLYIDSLVDRMIPSLSVLMNRLHRVDMSERFWKTYLIVWLIHWLGHCYDRYLRLKQLEQGGEIFKVKVLNSRAHPTKDYWDYMDKVTKSHYYNLSLMSDIIRACQFKFIIPEMVDIPCEVNREDNFKKRLFIKPKRLLRLVKSTLMDYLNSSVYLGSIYGISLIDRLYLQLRYDPFFFFRARGSGKSTEVKVDRNDLVRQDFKFGSRNEFEKIVETLLLRYIPEDLLKFYPRKSEDMPKIKIWIGNDVYYSEKDAFRIAEVCEHGGRWISAQHGGGYGYFLSFPLSKIEYETSGGFITWGWNEKHIYPSRYYPLTSPMLSKLPKHKEKSERIFYIGTMHPAYSYRLQSALQPEDLLDYLECKKRFFLNLSRDVRSKVRYKPYPHNYGMNEVEYLADVLSMHQFQIKGIAVKELKSSRLVVIDHPGTSLHESFSMNTPTILFWNASYLASTPLASPYFDRLRSVGIFFDTPEEAAKKVNEIWDDVQGWWQQSEIQSAKNEFCYQFARTSKNWRKEWVKFLKGLKT